MSKFRRVAVAVVVALIAALAGTARAQTPPAARAAAASAPAPAASAAAPAPAASGAAPERVEITGGRLTDTEERRRSTAAKIIIGREELDRMGDSTLGEIMKRLPGVTVQGRPGRGGQIRMRGLGSGYTQILLDGERVQGGLSLDTLTPDQVERIEIQRAPTAETGGRAIGGTINIITRETYTRKVNDLRLIAGYENDRLQPGISWTRNDSEGSFTYNLSASLMHRDRDTETLTTTRDVDLDNGHTLLRQDESAASRERGNNLTVTGRLQWRLDGGDQLMLMPFLLASQNDTSGASTLEQAPGSALQPPYERTSSDGDGGRLLARLNGQYRQNLGDAGRIEWRGGISQSNNRSDSTRLEFGVPPDEAFDPSTRLDDTDSRERTATLNAKYSLAMENDHSLVAGIESELANRVDTRSTLQDGNPLLTDFGDDLSARSTRFALYAQDEWTVSPNWAAHAGLRWEGIQTQGEGENNDTQRNRSSVWTPLLHAVWKPEPKSRDQVRFSLTRSYRSPTLSSLMGRPSLSAKYDAPGPNTPASPDRAGNPDLKPELATGLDVAFERYLPQGGLFSANLFHRRITDVIRTLTTLEDVSWSPGQPRWVARPQNIGDATTQGIELEAKARADELWDDAAPVDLRANLSLYRSKVDGVPGPDNRLDQQPSLTANLGADYRLRSLPLTLGGNLGWTPGYTTRLSDTQIATIGDKRVFDAYALWTFSPSLRLRLSASNLAPQDYETGGAIDFQDLDNNRLRESVDTVTKTYVNWQLRLEMKL